MAYPLGSRWVSMWAMKKGSGCLGYVGDEQLPSYVGIIWNDERRIPIKQPGWLMSKKSPTGPTEWTPQPEYLIALTTYLGVRW